MRTIILGAGPAGLTAAYELAKTGHPPLVFEKDADVGGISRTINYKGYLFDIGGHRFFTKFEEVKRIWDEILKDEFITRPRLSRIYYNNKFFYYPLKPWNALKNLGLKTSLAVMGSYIYARLRPYKSPVNFEEWVTNKFGRKLFQIFFKTYTEKVWGMPCREIQADWAAQRIKSLSLGRAVIDALGIGKKNAITTLIDEFQYPRKGPGQMWRAAAALIKKGGGNVVLNSPLVRFSRAENRILTAVVARNGKEEAVSGDYFLSSIPLRELILRIEPPPPEDVLSAARGLRYRDFFSVGLMIRKKDIFPDTWIYIHSPEVRVGRIQNFKNWSPEMVPDPDTTSLGLEYFCFETDPVWKQKDADLVETATNEIEKLGFAERSEVLDGVVIRSPKTYPIYDEGYRARLETIKDYLGGIENLQTIGRNGLHRYNNQDHSMVTALLAVRNIMGERHSVWDVNVDDEYHEIGEKEAV